MLRICLGQPLLKKKNLSGQDAVGLKEVFGTTDPGPSSCLDGPSLEAGLLQTQMSLFKKNKNENTVLPAMPHDPSCLAWRVREHVPQGIGNVTRTEF